jgi:ubiquinone/menaquinone biosynthesis C-methylase UbiE
MTSPWDERADAYRTSVTHATGDDLDAVVDACAAGPGVRVLDVGSGGGHVARRLRELGADVVTCDSSQGMQPDIVCGAEDLPFADGSFDVVVSRLAAHHFERIGAAVAQMARVARSAVVIEDHLYVDETTETAEKLRDPSHVRAYSEEQWRRLLTDEGLEVERVERFDKVLDFDSWFARTGTSSADAERVRELLAPLTSPDGDEWTSPMIFIVGRAR